MEIFTRFTIFVDIKKEDEFVETEVEVEATGMGVYDGVSNEFGIEKELYVEDVKVDSIICQEFNEVISLNKVRKSDQNRVFQQAYQHLTNKLTEDYYE